MAWKIKHPEDWIAVRAVQEPKTMTNTQSVCKYCQQPIKLYVGVWTEVGKECAGVYCSRHRDSTQQHGTGFHEPVSEPASTGEPPPESLSVQKRKHYMAGGHASDFIPIREHDSTVTDGFGSEWPLRCEEDGCDGINQVMRPGSVQCSKEHLHNRAARPSEPSAPHAQTEAQHRSGLAAYGTTLKVLAEIDKQNAAPQTSAEPAHPERKYHAGTGYLIAAPQPVSGDAPTCCGMPMEKLRRLQSVEYRMCQRCGSEAGDVPKVEEIIDALEDLLTDCIADSDNGTMYWTNEGRQRAASLLRPYFPPASQTPVNREELAAELFRRHRMRHNGRTRNQSNLLSMWELLGAYERMEWLDTAADMQNISATPASTARTDGWVSVPHDLLMELRGVVVGEWNFVPLESDKAKYLHTLWTQIDAIRFPAAPGSVPQAPQGDNVLQDGPVNNLHKALAKAYEWNEARRVPQAEPPKEESK